eukprot:1145531-Pelagomonas_calceolata.AAC.5
MFAFASSQTVQQPFASKACLADIVWDRLGSDAARQQYMQQRITQAVAERVPIAAQLPDLNSMQPLPGLHITAMDACMKDKLRVCNLEMEVLMTPEKV